MKNKAKLILFSTSYSVQINSNEIIIFCGYNHENESTNLYYVFDVEYKIIKNYHNINIAIPEGFWNNTPIIHKNKIYSL